MDKDFVAAVIIPTGIGASIGGFAGDASPCVNLMSKVCPVITNPNAVNAAVFSGINPNIFYTEGFAIDLFFKREIALRPSKYNKIGVIFDKAIPEKVLNIHINTINAVKSTYGINIVDWAITNESVGIDFSISESGISTGNINNPETLVRSADELISKGVEALAVVCYFDEPEDDNYSSGSGVDSVGGVEAVISHLLTEIFRIPVAHAPGFADFEISTELVDKRVAAEYITPTFLPCILLGLYNAPEIIDINKANYFDLTLDSLGALIMPYNSMGSTPVIKAIENNIPVIAVENNKTILDITSDVLGFDDKVIKVKNYYEAAGVVLALKNGIIF